MNEFFNDIFKNALKLKELFIDEKINIYIEFSLDKKFNSQLLIDSIVDQDYNNEINEKLNRAREIINVYEISTIKIKKTYKDGRERIGLRIKKTFNDNDKIKVEDFLKIFGNKIEKLKKFIKVRKTPIGYKLNITYNLNFEYIYSNIKLSEKEKKLLENMFIRLKIYLPVNIKGNGLNLRDGKTMVWDFNLPEEKMIDMSIKIPTLKKNEKLELFL